MKETKDELVKRLLDVKAEQSNLIDLDAYALGLEAMYEAINYTRCCESDSEQLCDHIYFDNTQKPDNCIYCNYKREPKQHNCLQLICV